MCYLLSLVLYLLLIVLISLLLVLRLRRVEFGLSPQVLEVVGSNPIRNDRGFFSLVYSPAISFSGLPVPGRTSVPGVTHVKNLLTVGK